MFEELDRDQRDAVTSSDGPILVLAGPGTGKTRTLINRIIYLILERNISPERILATTFTRKASIEMLQRLKPFTQEPIRVETIHSFCLKVLRKYGEYAGIDPQAPVIEKKDTTTEGITFDEIITRTLMLFKKCPPIREEFKNRYKYLLIDEYQDIDHTQKELFHLLSGPCGNIFAIGDPDQAIYSFRGAHVGNFLSFQKDYKDVKLIRLTRNYRSRPAIVYGAEGMISNNRERLHKPQIPVRDDDGGKINIVALPDERSEMEFIIHEIEKLIGGATSYSLYKNHGFLKKEREYGFSDFAVLFRTNEQIRRAEEIWERSGIPYQVIRGERFPHAPMEKVLHLFRVILSPHRHKNLELNELLEVNIDNILLLKDKSSGFSNYIKELLKVSRVLDGDGKGLLEGIITMAMAWEGYPFEEALQGLIDDITLSSDMDYLEDHVDRVTLMTMHAAKGLEFPVVFICGVEDGLIPFTLHKKDKGYEHIEEERRLFYVALTRAKDMAYILYSSRRYIYGRQLKLPPSRFIKEIPGTYCTYRETGSKKKVRKDKQLRIF